MIVNGQDLRRYMRIRRINRTLLPEIENVAFDVPGRHGLFHIRNRQKQRVIEVEYDILSKSREEMLEKIRILSGHLYSDHDMTVILPDEPDFIYTASVTGETSIEDLIRTGLGVFTLFCSEPSAMDAADESNQFGSDGHISVMNYGSDITFPRFNIVFSQQVTNFEIKNLTTNKSVRLGDPLGSWDEIDDEPIEYEELIFFDTMTSTSGWTEGTHVDGGVIDGQMIADGGFTAEDYGSGDRWHGPALQRSLTENIQDFRVDARLWMRNDIDDSVGRVEIYLLDSNGNSVGKIGLKDVSEGAERRLIEARAGGLNNGRYLYSSNESSWDTFQNWVTLERIGNKWRAYFDFRDSEGRVIRYRQYSYVNADPALQASLSAIQVHVGTSRERTPTENIVEEVKVYKINKPEQAHRIPIIAHGGDTLEIDNGLNRVLRNGVPFMQAVDLDNDFFELERGPNQLEVFPKGVADVTMNWRRRWI